MLATSFDFHAGEGAPNGTTPNGTASNGTATLVPLDGAIVVGGVTSLAFSDDGGGEVEVGGLTEPIKFSMPFSGEDYAQCAFWDKSANGYSSRGCFTLPNPIPPTSSVRWAANFTLALQGNATEAEDADFADAWEIDDPGLLEGCVVIYSKEGFRDFAVNGSVFDVPQGSSDSYVWIVNRLEQEAIARGGCDLIRPENVAGCWWNGTVQAFQGPGCVYAPATECMCTHLTDFVSSLAPPKIRIASAKDLAITPADVLNIWKMALLVLGLVVVGIGAAGLMQYDTKNSRQGFVATLMHKEYGFTRSANGAWMWKFHQEIDYPSSFEAMKSSIDHNKPAAMKVAGPGPSILSAMQMSYNRVRSAVPLETIRATKLARPEEANEHSYVDPMALWIELLDRKRQEDSMLAQKLASVKRQGEKVKALAARGLEELKEDLNVLASVKISTAKTVGMKVMDLLPEIPKWTAGSRAARRKHDANNRAKALLKAEAEYAAIEAQAVGYSGEMEEAQRRRRRRTTETQSMAREPEGARGESRQYQWEMRVLADQLRHFDEDMENEQRMRMTARTRRVQRLREELTRERERAANSALPNIEPKAPGGLQDKGVRNSLKKNPKVALFSLLNLYVKMHLHPRPRKLDAGARVRLAASLRRPPSGPGPARVSPL
mmetsp:Transcript_57287/g.181243  ORF Transcript_57287/g.181243 Transcript_57287/m.181243 type:complete len:660 (-) Transcript_57287:2449-4428(-)